ncbi:expressed unknown protein [Seminavis robusta]|uniref:K Homology domain-containing protein n=1 Tax=Seminavis robusta TaxID=568900 RepID=A0A9N8HIA1_9STRA|nr:expressed unknown protein [Seminavis robusta]|eukprot:Sro488_g153120.1 n/a (397) ;mRNA; r:37707-38897
MKVAPATATASSSAAAVTDRITPDTDDKVLLSIAAKQSVLIQPLITLTCYIPSASVGAVIGRKGQTVDKIQHKAQQAGTSHGLVRLCILGNQQNELVGDDHSSRQPQQAQQNNSETASSPEQQQSPSAQPNNAATTTTTTTTTHNSSSSSSVPYTYTELDFSDPNWTPVVIRSDPCATLVCAQLLNEKAGRIMDDVIMDVPLGRNKHAAVVGRRGFILGNLSADCHVRIMIPRKELRHDIIQLEGELENVKQCLERILEITSTSTSNSNNEQQQAGGKKKANDKQQEKDEESETVTLPVLPPQTKLKTIGKKTETAIKKKKTEDGHWDLTVFGTSAENVKAAVLLLKKLSDTATKGSPTGASSSTPTRARGRGRQRNNKKVGNNSKHNKSGKSPPS